LTGSDQPDQTATEVFRALQAKARADHDGDTHSLLVLYAVESFLRRLAASEHARRLVLKGGMLMAANDIRAITRDADLSAHATAGEQATVHELVAEICALKVEPPDGVRIDPATIRTETMRAQDEYHGVRCKLTASLGQARASSCSRSLSTGGRMSGRPGETGHPCQQRVVVAVRPRPALLREQRVKAMLGRFGLLDPGLPGTLRHVVAESPQPWSSDLHQQRSLAFAPDTQIVHACMQQLFTGKDWYSDAHASNRTHKPSDGEQARCARRDACGPGPTRRMRQRCPERMRPGHAPRLRPGMDLSTSRRSRVVRMVRRQLFV
jgi:Nucleotidyl transferase AbiEii toxin, Type IV TA system